MSYLKVVEGKGGVIARVVAKSCSYHEKESIICTFELEYPRFIHSELMTHRLFSRNAMSSRAVPISRMIHQVRNNPAMPIHWGKNQAGMQADNELSGTDLTSAKDDWCVAAKTAAAIAERMNDYGAHKQIVNRILEPFQMMKTVVTATEFDNFFWLRCHSDAQPEIKELADCMYQAYSEVEAEVLKAGEWHTPYVDHVKDCLGNVIYMSEPCNTLPEDHKDYHKTIAMPSINKDDALKVSSSCCAQVSYRVLDNSLDKALDIYSRLFDSVPVHASPFEHQASPMSQTEPKDQFDGDKGTTHVDSGGYAWSGNFKGWIQYRQMLENHTCWEYKPK